MDEALCANRGRDQLSSRHVTCLTTRALLDVVLINSTTSAVTLS
jgi:hypothetical protein